MQVLRAETIRAFKAIIMNALLVQFYELYYRQASMLRANKVRKSQLTEDKKQNPTSHSNLTSI